jgi:hypothetical protein
MGRTDELSRRGETPKSEWKLNPRVFEQLDLIWGPHKVDLFASAANTQLPRYFSWAHDPSAEGWDALQQDWRSLKGFANPPFALLGRVLTKVAMERLTLTLVAPWWPSRPWFPTLLQMCCDWPLEIVGEATWIASGAAEGEDGSRQWRLVAWRISGDTSQIEAFHERRSSSWARLTLEAPPTIRSGESGCVGASAGAFRHGGPTR